MFTSRSHTGKVKRNNQDYLGIDEALYCAVIADGVSGNAHGEVASQLAVDACLHYLNLEHSTLMINPEKELANSLKVANEEIITIQRNEPKYQNMSTTLACFSIQNQSVSYAWVGDSRIYLIRTSDQSVRMLTTDHTLDQSKIDPDLAPDLYQRAPNILTRSVGSILLLKPDTGTIAIQQGDLILACTDGLTNHVSDELLLEYALQQSALEDLAEKLLERALDCGGKDNISLVLAELSEPNRCI